MKEIKNLTSIVGGETSGACNEAMCTFFSKINSPNIAKLITEKVVNDATDACTSLEDDAALGIILDTQQFVIDGRPNGARLKAQQYLYNNCRETEAKEEL